MRLQDTLIFKHKKKIIGTSLGLVLFFFLWKQISLEDVRMTLSLVTWDVIVLVFGLTGVMYLLRALRFYFLFKRQLPIGKLFLIVCAHTLANHILPARTGEVTLIYLAKRSSKLNVPYITASLLVARLLDLFWTLTAFVVLLWALQDISPELLIVRNVSLVAAIGIIIGVFFVFRYQDRILDRLGSKNHKKAWKKKLSDLIVRGSEVVQLLKSSPSLIASLSIYTILIWTLAFYTTYLMTSAMGVDLGYFKVAIGSLFVVCTSVLPVNSFMGIGMYEGAWTLGMVLLGLSKDLAIASGVSMHMIRVATYFVFGSLGLRLFFQSRKKR